MNLVKSGLLIAVPAFGLAACDIPSPAEIQAVIEVATEAATQASDLDDLRTTNNSLTVTTTPLSGTATYTGQAGMTGFEGSTRYTVGGDMTLNADFDAGTTTATITDILGSDLSEDEYDELQSLENATGFQDRLRAFNLASRIVEANGDLSFTGTVTGAAITMTGSGTTTFDGSDYAVSGDVSGNVKGTTGEGVTLNDGTGFAFTKDGTALTSTDFRAELSN